MTERARPQVARGRHEFVVGPSRLHWTGGALEFDIDERGAPLPRAVRGRVRVIVEGLGGCALALDAAGQHHWAPIAPVATVEADFIEPRLRWRGRGYFDCNQGGTPIETAFDDWDWARASLPDGSTAVVYDVRPKQGPDRVLALRLAADGRIDRFAAPPRHALPRTFWRLRPSARGDERRSIFRVRSFEDTPFYARAAVQTCWAGQPVLSMHETLDLRRLRSPLVRSMLPVRMPRRGAG